MLHDAATYVLSLTIAALPSLANGVEGFDATKLAVYGPLGIIVAWFMIRYERRADRSDARMLGLETAMDRATRAQLLMLIELPSVCDAAKGQGQLILKEIDAADTTRAAIQKT